MVLLKNSWGGQSSPPTNFFLMDGGYLLSLTLLYKEINVELEISKFNETSVLKIEPTNPSRMYMFAKQDRDVNVMLPNREKNKKQYFFYVSDQQESKEGDNLIKSSSKYVRIVIRNMSSYRLGCPWFKVTYLSLPHGKISWPHPSL